MFILVILYTDTCSQENDEKRRSKIEISTSVQISRSTRMDDNQSARRILGRDHWKLLREKIDMNLYRRDSLSDAERHHHQQTYYRLSSDTAHTQRTSMGMRCHCVNACVLIYVLDGIPSSPITPIPFPPPSPN